MLQAGARFDLITFPGAQHAFSNPAATDAGKRFGIPLAYNADADRVSWAGFTEFLQDVFDDSSAP